MPYTPILATLGYVLSPDGSAVLIPPERIGGTTLWRIDLQKATAAYREAKARGK